MPENTALFAPMPSASVSTMIAVRPGVRLKARAAKRLFRRRHMLAAAGRTVLVGAGIGLVTAAVAGRSMQAMFFGVSPLDAVALTTAPAMILVVAVAAAVIPARRAARIDPIVSLRAE
jgi:putative ABC transport system permease protein